MVWMCVGHMIRSVICDPEGNAGGSASMSIFLSYFLDLVRSVLDMLLVRPPM